MGETLQSKTEKTSDNIGKMGPRDCSELEVLALKMKLLALKKDQQQLQKRVFLSLRNCFKLKVPILKMRLNVRKVQKRSKPMFSHLNHLHVMRKKSLLKVVALMQQELLRKKLMTTIQKSTKKSLQNCMLSQITLVEKFLYPSLKAVEERSELFLPTFSLAYCERCMLSLLFIVVTCFPSFILSLKKKSI